MSFDKAELRRFNEAGSAAPPPTAYTPKFVMDKKQGIVFMKSQRFPTSDSKQTTGGDAFVQPIPYPNLSRISGKQRSSSSSSINRLARGSGKGQPQSPGRSTTTDRDTTEQNLIQLNNDLRIKLSSANELQESMESAISELQMQVSILEDKKTELAMDKEELASDLTKLRLENEELQHVKLILSDRIEAMQKTITNQDLKEQSLIELNDGLSAQLDSANDQQQYLDSIISGLQLEVSLLNEQKTELIMEKEELTSGLTNLHNKVEEFQHKLLASVNVELEIRQEMHKLICLQEEMSTEKEELVTQKQELMNEKSILQDHVEEMQNIINARDGKEQSLQQMNHDLSNQLEIAVDEQQSLASKVAELQLEVSLLNDKKCELIDEKTELWGDATNLRQEVEELQKKLLASVKAEHEFRQEMHDMISRQEEMTAEKEELISHKQELMDEKFRLRDRVEEMQEMITARDRKENDKILRLREELSIAMDQNEQLQLRQTQLQTTITNQDLKEQSLIELNDGLSAQLDSANDQQQYLDSIISGLQLEVSLLNEQKTELIMEKEELTSGLTNLHNKVEEFQHKLLASVNVELEISQKMHKLICLQEEMSTEKEDLVTQKQELMNEKSILQDHVEEMQNIINARDHKEQSLQQMNHDLSNQLEIAVDEQQSLASKVSELQLEVSLLNDKKCELIDEKTELWGDATNLRQEVEELQKKLLASVKAEHEFRQEMHDMISRQEEMTAEREELISHKQELMDEKFRLRDRVEEMQEMITARDRKENDKILRLREELSIAMVQNEQLQLRQTQLQTELEERNSVIKTHLEDQAKQNIEFRSLGEGYVNRLGSILGQVSQFVVTKKEFKRVNKENEKLIHRQERDLKANMDYVHQLESQLKVTSAHLQQSRAENGELEAECAILKPKSKLAEDLSQELLQIQQENQQLSRENERLTSLIAPFKDQLTAYESEMRMEKEGKIANHEKLEEVAHKYAELLGNQNKNQRIKHIIKLKDENMRLRQENDKYRMDLLKSHQAKGQLERELSAKQRR